MAAGSWRLLLSNGFQRIEIWLQQDLNYQTFKFETLIKASERQSQLTMIIIRFQEIQELLFHLLQGEIYISKVILSIYSALHWVVLPSLTVDPSQVAVQWIRTQLNASANEV